MRGETGRAPRVVVYRIGQLGDTVVAVPALRAIRGHFPDSHIALLGNVGPGWISAADVLPPAGLVDEHLTYPASAGLRAALESVKLLRLLRRRRFDTLVHLGPRLRRPEQVRRDLVFFRLAGIRRVIGARGFAPLGPRGRGALPMLEHEADHLLHRLALSGIAASVGGGHAMDLALTDGERATAASWLRRAVPGFPDVAVVGIGPGSKQPSKIWPEARFAEMGRHLVERFDVHPIVFGGPEDAPVARRLIDTWGRGTAAVGALTVRESAAALAFCRLYVGNDTGTMHLAAAVGTPCVAIFSARDWPGRWYPYGAGHTVLRRAVPCEGCLLARCEREALRCLTEIDVLEVTRACSRVLDRAGVAELR